MKAARTKREIPLGSNSSKPFFSKKAEKHSPKEPPSKDFFFEPSLTQLNSTIDSNSKIALSSNRYRGNPRLQTAFHNLPPIRYGEKGEAISLIQSGLVEEGFTMPNSTLDSGEMDGIFGAETLNNIIAFQTKHHLEIDGVVGKQTLGKLDAIAHLNPVSPACFDQEEIQEEFVPASYQPNNEGEINPFTFPNFCKLGSQLAAKKNKIVPQNPGKKQDFKGYKCKSTKVLDLHIYYHPSDYDVVNTQGNAMVRVLTPYNIETYGEPADILPHAEIVEVRDLCTLAKDAITDRPPAKGSLPVFFVKIEGHNGSTWDKSHCASEGVDLPGGINKIVAVDINTPNDTTMVHETGHAIGNDHLSALKDPENIMFASNKKLDRKYLWLQQLRKFCNAKF